MKRSERLNDNEESLRLALEGHQAKVWTSIPGIVNTVDLTAQTLTVQPAIQGIILDENSNSTSVNLPLCVDVPIVWPRAGGFSLTFPIKSGDEVLLVFSSRCIDSWWQNGGIGSQAELRMHDLSDGYAILAPTSQPKRISNVSSENVQLRTDTGGSYIEITPDGKINIVSTGEINVNSNSCSINSQECTVSGAQKVDIDSLVEIALQSPIISMAGNVAITNGGLTINGSDYTSHRHSGVETGSFNSGPVV